MTARSTMSTVMAITSVTTTITQVGRELSTEAMAGREGGMGIKEGKERVKEVHGDVGYEQKQKDKE